MKSAKLTLRMEEALIEKAKRVAKERGTSVSGMVAGFFDGLERARPATGQRHGPITSRLRGSLKPKEGKSLSADETDYLRHPEEKHG